MSWKLEYLRNIKKTFEIPPELPPMRPRPRRDSWDYRDRAISAAKGVALEIMTRRWSDAELARASSIEEWEEEAARHRDRQEERDTETKLVVERRDERLRTVAALLGYERWWMA